MVLTDSENLFGRLSNWWNSLSLDGYGSEVFTSQNSVSSQSSGDIDAVLRYHLSNKRINEKPSNDMTKLLGRLDQSYQALASDAEDVTDIKSLQAFKNQNKFETLFSDMPSTSSILHDAITENHDNRKILDTLLSLDSDKFNGVLINKACGKQSWTPLHKAALIGADWAVTLLLRAGAAVDKVDVEGNTPLMLACTSIRKTEKSGHKSVKLLLNAPDTNINHKNHRGLTAASMACLCGDSSSLEMLIEKNADINHVAQGGLTPLHIAALHGNVKCVVTLKRRGANQNVLTDNQQTPLSMACIKGSLDCCASLIEGTNQKFILPALYTALRNRNSKCALKIVYSNIGTGMDLAPALFLAIESNLGSNKDDSNLLEMMVSQMDVTKQSMRNGNSALTLAAMKGNAVALQIIMGQGWSNQDVEKAYQNASSDDIKQILKPAEVVLSTDRCVVCMDADPNVKFMSCNHMCCCSNCAVNVEKHGNQCPVCRTNITKTKLIRN